MRVDDFDRATLATVKPFELTTYLRGRGWNPLTERDNKATVWTKESSDGFEFDVLVPENRRFADYAIRVGELLRTLSEAEGRSQAEILRELQSTTSDLLRVRAPHPEAESGTLPLDLAVTFVERSRDMMLAAACATIDKRSVYARRKPQAAMNYLHNLRMGQTERGSFVLTILSPVPPELKVAQQPLIHGLGDVPFERKVTTTLMTSLSKLSQAAKLAAKSGAMEPFQESVASGVSANLCDAVVGMADVTAGEPVDIRMTWSASRPQELLAPDQVFFDSDVIPFISEAARQFRETAPVTDVEIEGLVVRLDRQPKAQEGDVTVTAIADGDVRRVSIHLSRDAYAQAVLAHHRRKPVRCTGELIKEGIGFKLINPRDFRVVDDGASLFE